MVDNELSVREVSDIWPWDNIAKCLVDSGKLTGARRGWHQGIHESLT